MKIRTSMPVALSGGLCLFALAMTVRAVGVAAVSGGASVEEFAALNREASNYSLKLVFAARGSGAYLADVDVTLKSLPGRETVLERRTEGPLLLAALPPGRYEMTAVFHDVVPGAPTTQRRLIQVPRHGRAQAVVRFDTGDQVGAESPPEYVTR